jgi:hypothetical protein
MEGYSVGTGLKGASWGDGKARDLLHMAHYQGSESTRAGVSFGGWEMVPRSEYGMTPGKQQES